LQAPGESAAGFSTARPLSEQTIHEVLALEHWQAIRGSGDSIKLRVYR
jgi:hypothetical protein